MRASFLPSNLRSALPLILLCSMLLLAAPGCSGCFGGSTTANKKKTEEEEKKKKKPDFEVGRLRVQPSDDTSQSKNAVKPGHWTVTTQPLLANHYEFPAELHAASVDRSGNQLRIEATQYQMTVSTPAPLPKALRKDYEMTYFVPSIYSNDTNTASAAWLGGKLIVVRQKRLSGDGPMARLDRILALRRIVARLNAQTPNLEVWLLLFLFLFFRFFLVGGCASAKAPAASRRGEEQHGAEQDQGKSATEIGREKRGAHGDLLGVSSKSRSLVDGHVARRELLFVWSLGNEGNPPFRRSWFLPQGPAAFQQVLA